MNPIEQAVLPLMEQAMDKAEQWARSKIEAIGQDLVANNNDLNIIAPYPSSRTIHDRKEYELAMSKYRMYRYVCKGRAGSRRMNDPEFADLCQEKIDRFVAESREMASLSYEGFIAKLIAKVGKTPLSAELDGNHVWGSSILYIKHFDGSEEKWKTKCILNVSKLGKLFNQWPTRKIK